MPGDDWILRSLRGTRANPPERAADDPDRRALFGAGLEQFEQLLKASQVVGPPARPLPLFYALSQAGRAIVAAKGADPEITGHGLSEDKSQQPPPIDLLHRRIKRSPSRNGRDAFTAVSRATGAADLKDGIELGAVWSALPETYRIPESSWLEEWRPPLPVLDETSYRGKEGKVQIQAMSMSGNPHHNEVSTLKGRYPTLPPQVEIGLKSADSGLGPGNWIVVLSWDEQYSLDEVAPLSTSTDGQSRHLVPTLPGHDECLSPLMMWWVLLYGLSIFARYHPGLWIKALDVESSELAVPIEGVLDHALTAVPALVHRELLG